MPINNEDANELEQARSTYTYPTGSVIVSAMAAPEFGGYFPFSFEPGVGAPQGLTCIAFDDAINRQMTSTDALVQRQSLASVVFWGHLTANVPYARNRVAWLVTPPTHRRIGLCHCEIPNRMNEMILHLANDAPGEALAALHPISQLGLAFASKVVAFAAPDRAGVLDNKIMRSLLKWSTLSDSNGLRARLGTWAQQNGFVPARMSYPVNSPIVIQIYGQWCWMLRCAALRLNECGSVWSREGVDPGPNRWRAVDVERAIFALAE